MCPAAMSCHSPNGTHRWRRMNGAEIRHRLSYILCKSTGYLLLVDMCDFHVHGMDGGEDIGGALNHTLARLGHGNGCAGG